MLFLVGTIIVTMVFNVPLNDTLAAISPTSAEGASAWTTYLNGWLPWNHVRTVANFAALAAFIFAFAQQSQA